MWFSFVELIIVISIIALISVIWVSINSNYTEKTKNSKISSDILTIKSSLEAYNNENKKLPDPKWNQKFFDDSSNYVHYDDATAFWVYGNITEDTIPKKYMNFAPIDPRTNQFYAYGKTLTWTPMFQLSWVNKINWIYESKVVWNYTWETGPYNLIREYNWPDFVFDQSINSFPYNPEEKVLKWKIWSFLWDVKVNGNPIDKTRIKNNDLISWDVIEVAALAEAQIHYSDWSKSYLWDPDKASKLTLANMVYKDENNLFTRIQLALDFWSIWTKTSKLDPNSDFEIYTTDTEAAVRWTIFGVTKDWATKVAVQTWSVEITKIMWVTDVNTIINKLKNDDVINTNNLASVSGPNTATNDWIVSIFSVWQTVESTIWTTSISTPITIPNPNIPDEDWLTNITPKIKSINAWVVVLEFPSSFSGTSNWKKVYKNLAPLTNTDYEFNLNLLTLSWSITESNYSIKVCDKAWIKCTKEVSINKTVTYGDIPTAPVWCAPNEADFWTLWCIEKDSSFGTDWDLIAYAPYNEAWNLDMYLQDWSVLPKSTDWILNNSTDNDSLPSWCSNINSFCEIDWVKWIFIWTWTNINDYLFYTLPESLSWATNFAIEINLLGNAIIKNGPYSYFHSSLSNIRAFKQSSNLKYFLDWTNSNLINNYSGISGSNFYKIIFKKDWSIQYMTIKDDNTIYSNTSTWADSTKTLSNDLYIWSLSSTNYPLNDIINYVKIYKK